MKKNTKKIRSKSKEIEVDIKSSQQAPSNTTDQASAEISKNRINPRITALITALVLVSLVLSFVIWKLFFAQPVTFELDDQDYTYQITKCWKTNPPTFWIQQFKSDSTGSKHEGCDFKGKAIVLERGDIDFNKWLNRDIIAEGELKNRWGNSVYRLSSVKYRVSNNPTVPTSQSKLYITRNTNEGNIIVYSTSISMDYPQIIRWKNYLFFPPSSDFKSYNFKADYSPETKLVSYNLSTGEISAVYEEDTTKISRMLSDLQVIDDTLFFTVSGYLAGGETFWLDSPEGNPQEVVHDMPMGTSAIEKINDMYWLIGGEGDSCWGEKYFYLLDTKTKRASSVAMQYSHCDEGGEIFLGIDNKDRMIMAMYESNQMDYQRYTQISAIPITNPSHRVILLSKEDFPENTMSLNYSPEQNKLLVSGNDISIFDLETKSLDMIAELPADWDRVSIGGWKDDKACVIENHSAGKNWFVLDIQSGGFEENTGYCEEVVPFMQNSKSQQTLKESEEKTVNYIKNLELPSEYQIMIN